jgi:hypothetical protein
LKPGRSGCPRQPPVDDGVTGDRGYGSLKPEAREKLCRGVRGVSETSPLSCLFTYSLRFLLDVLRTSTKPDLRRKTGRAEGRPPEGPVPVAIQYDDVNPANIEYRLNDGTGTTLALYVDSVSLERA